MPSSPHDKLVRRTFADVAHARGLLRSIVLAPLSSHIDWDSLELLDGTFIDPRLAARQTGLLYSVRIDGREALLFVLLEHQSSSDRWMPLRMYVYLGRIWERYVEHNQSADRLPPILPIVLHHSERGWSAPTSLRALVDADDDLAKLLGSALPELQFQLVDLTHIDDATIKLWLTTDLSRLVALCLKHAPYEADLRPRLYEWVDLFGAVVRSPSGAAALAAVTRYLLEVNEIAAPVLLDVLESALEPEALEAVMTGAERLREEGRAEGRAAIILKQLALRFAPLSAETIARVQACSSDELDRIAERILSAKSLDELFG